MSGWRTIICLRRRSVETRLPGGGSMALRCDRMTRYELKEYRMEKSPPDWTILKSCRKRLIDKARRLMLARRPCESSVQDEPFEACNRVCLDGCSSRRYPPATRREWSCSVCLRGFG